MAGSSSTGIDCLEATFAGEIDAPALWTGEPQRDEHLRSADFFDVANHPKIMFSGHFTERTADTAFKGEVDLTIRGTTRTVPLDISYIGEWKTPFWVGDENKGELRRIGFEADRPHRPPRLRRRVAGRRARRRRGRRATRSSSYSTSRRSL